MEQSQALAVRKLSGKSWEVLIVANDQWVECENEEDANTIAKMPIYQYEALKGERKGEAFAVELDQLADTLEKYNMKEGARFFRHSAKLARST